MVDINQQAHSSPQLDWFAYSDLMILILHMSFEKNFLQSLVRTTSFNKSSNLIDKEKLL